MTALESVLTSRNASLSDMVALLQRQHDAKLDVVVPARDLRMSGGDLHIEGIGEPTITRDGVTPARGVFCLIPNSRRVPEFVSGRLLGSSRLDQALRSCLRDRPRF